MKAEFKVNKLYCITSFKKNPTNALECMNVILLHSNHRHVC